MSDYNKETAFLRQILCHDTSCESKRVDETIARVHRERASVDRVAVGGPVTRRGRVVHPRPFGQ